MFAGQRTYITAGLAVIGAVAAYLVGDMTMAESAQIVVTSILAVFLRKGITSENAK